MEGVSLDLDVIRNLQGASYYPALGDMEMNPNGSFTFASAVETPSRYLALLIPWLHL